jgi:AcrR family transcriptional regulator
MEKSSKKKQQENTKDLSTEEKIKAAARQLFTKKGYSATRTRDIAEAAGINLALLNYYFRSKEKLFDLVMLENFGQFIHGVRNLFNDKNSSLDQKIEQLVDFYITQIVANPDLPLFVLNEIRSDPKKLQARGFLREILRKSYFMQQLIEELARQKRTDIKPIHIVMNIFSMSIFPFVAAPMIRWVGEFSEQEFIEIMQERKKLIPVWIKKMIAAK